MTALFTALLLAAVVALPLRRHPAPVRERQGLRCGAGAALGAVRGVPAAQGRRLLARPVRPDLADRRLVTGMTYTRDHAVLPSKNILMFIAVICAVLFFANVVRRTWLLPGVGLALFAISAVLLGGVWPGLMQRFQVKPDEPDKEAIVHRQEHPGHALGLRPRRHHGQRVQRQDQALAPAAATSTPRRCPASACSTRSWSPRPSTSCSRCAATTACRPSSTSTATRSTARSATSWSPLASCTSTACPTRRRSGPTRRPSTPTATA